MIRAPLQFHTPESIYLFLQKNIGPLFMVIKNCNAIIQFSNSKDAEKALELYSVNNIARFPFKLYRYTEGDLDKQPQPMDVEPAIQPQPVVVVSAISQQTKMIQNALQVKDMANPIQRIVKKHRKQIVEYLASYQVLLKQAEKKYLEVQQIEENKEQSIDRLQKKIDSQLKMVTNNFKNQMRKATSLIKQIGQLEVNLEPILQSGATNCRPLQSQKFKAHIQYINEDIDGQIKKIAALNQDQFVCVGNHRLKSSRVGCVKAYRKEEQRQVSSASFKEQGYGLLVLNNHVLIGNMQNSISFFSLTSFGQFQITSQIHNNYILDIIKNSSTPTFQSILTLSSTQAKMWNVSQQLVTEDMSTLFFDESGTIESEGKILTSMDIYQEGRKLLLGCHTQTAFQFCQYDLVTCKLISKQQIRYSIYKIKKMNQSTIAAANNCYLNFIDPRTAIIPQSGFKFKTDLKAILPFNDYSIFCGTFTGEVGVIDSRKPNQLLWNNTNNHKDRIYDIARVGNLIVTGDCGGNLVSWQTQQLNGYGENIRSQIVKEVA